MTLSTGTDRSAQTIWASSWENLSSGFPTRVDSNRPAELQGLARVLKFRIYRDIILSRQWKIKMLIRLCGCAGWSAPLLFALGMNRFSHDMVHIYQDQTEVAAWSWSALFAILPSSFGFPNSKNHVVYTAIVWDVPSFRIFAICTCSFVMTETNIKYEIRMSLVTRKPVFGVFDQVRLKPACLAAETSWRLEISDIETGDIILSRKRTTKVLIRLHGCAGWSAPLLFTYGINRFSHDEAQIISQSLHEQMFWLVEGYKYLSVVFASDFSFLIFYFTVLIYTRHPLG